MRTVITRSAAGGIEIALPVTMLSVTPSTRLPSPLLWLPPRRPRARPGDIFISCWSLGCPTAFDVLVISPLQEHTIAHAAQTPSHALQVGVQRKLAANLSVCRSSGTDFVSLVAETLGGLAEDTIRTITNISRAIENRCGTSDSTPQLPVTCLAAWQWLYGGAMLPCGSTVSPLYPPSRTV